jgi:hypothetical protein
MGKMRTLTMVHSPWEHGGCYPKSDADLRLLSRLVKANPDRFLPPGREHSGIRLIALCRDQNIRLILDPAQSEKQPPSPSPARGRGGRQK